ncbi:signal peptide peptidase SppA [Niabella terrae]
MKSFLKTFLAVLLALFIAGFLGFVFFAGIVGSLMSRSATAPVAEKSVLQIDLSTHYEDNPETRIQEVLEGGKLQSVPSLYDVVRLIDKAATDDRIKGIYLVANGNGNGFASSDELRQALSTFKQSKKFILAHGDMMSQQAYGVANIADEVFVNPEGSFDWLGYSVDYMFLKGTLDKLNIKPQIFYAGKFKSATEPLRLEQMSEENKLQTTAWLGDIYTQLLIQTAESRDLDSAELRLLAVEGGIETPADALEHHLIDGLKYNDELQDAIKDRLELKEDQKISFVSIEQYADAHPDLGGSGEDIALIYAQGDIVDGKGQAGEIAGDVYLDLLRKARMDKKIKAIVLRVNSGGGSALASEKIWREMSLAREVKPVIVSFGDVAASGGYYISCAADSIFASPTTITGSIGVFGIIPDMSAFFKEKLGVTFDGVQTGPLANTGSPAYPLAEKQKELIQHSIEDIYSLFKSRVSEGRGIDTADLESIAQGRVWSGLRAVDQGLVDGYGGLQRAVEAAASRAGLTSYQVREFPEPDNWFKQLFGLSAPSGVSSRMKEELGEEYYKVFVQLRKVKSMCQVPQTRLPFDFVIR